MDTFSLGSKRFQFLPWKDNEILQLDIHPQQLLESLCVQEEAITENVANENQQDHVDPIRKNKRSGHPTSKKKAKRENSNWCDCPLTMRDQALAALYIHIFGPQVEAKQTCKECKIHYQIDFDIEQMATSVLRLSVEGGSQSEQTIDQSTWYKKPKWVYKLPSYMMLKQANHNEKQLLKLMFSDTKSQDIDLEELFEEDSFWQDVATKNPVLDADIDSECPSCGHVNWVRYCHIEYFSQKLSALRQRILNEFHLLAKTYHWHFDEIQSLDDYSRKQFVQRVQKDTDRVYAKLEGGVV